MLESSTSIVAQRCDIASASKPFVYADPNGFVAGKA